MDKTWVRFPDRALRPMGSIPNPRANSLVAGLNIIGIGVEMYLSPQYQAVDGPVNCWQPPNDHPYSTPIIYNLIEHGEEIKDKYWDEFDLTMVFFMDRCHHGGVVTQTSDRILKKFREGWHGEECSTCRGKGHSWSPDCEVWDGKPFFITKKENGQTDTSKINWDKPDWCKDCKGTGIK